MSSQAVSRAAKEISSILFNVKENRLKYCCVCFRTEEERKLMEPTEHFFKCQNIMGLQFPCVAICYVCEAESKRAYSLLQAIRFASIISNWYRTFGDGLTFQHQMATSLDSHISNKRIYRDKLGNGVWWRRLRARGELVQTEVLAVGGDVPEESVVTAEPSQMQQPRQDPGRPPPAPRPPPLAQSSSTNKPVEDSIVIIDDDEDLPPLKPTPALKPLYIFTPPPPLLSAQQPPIITAPTYSFENQTFVQSTPTQSNNNIVTQISDITPSGCVLQRLIVSPEETYYVVAPIQNNLPKPQNDVAPIQNNVTQKLQYNVAPIQNVTPKLQNNVAPIQIVTQKLQNNVVPIQNVTPKLQNNVAPIQNVTQKLQNNVAPIQNVTPKIQYNVAPIQNVTQKQQNNVAPIQNVTQKQQNNVAPIQNVTPKQQNNVAPMNNCILKPQNKVARIQNNSMQKLHTNVATMQNNFTPKLHNNMAISVPQPKLEDDPIKKEIISMLEEHVLNIEASPMIEESEPDINISQVRTLEYSAENNDDDDDDQKAQVVKRPVMSGRIDWEDKIPMDVISFVDASDPMMHKESSEYEPEVPKRPRKNRNSIIDLG